MGFLIKNGLNTIQTRRIQGAWCGKVSPFLS